MAAEDELEVKMRLVLDEEDVQRAVKHATEKATVPLGPPTPGDPSKAPPTSRPSPASFRDMGKAFADSFKEQQGKLADGKLAGFGQLALPAAAGLLILGGLKELGNAVKSVTHSLLQLGASLARFNPEINVAFRLFGVQMRLLAIDMGRVLGPAIADLVGALGDLIREIYFAIKPALVVVAGLIHVAAGAIRFVAGLINGLAKAVAYATLGLAKLGEWVAGLLGSIFPGVASGLNAASQALAKSAEKWIEALDGKGRPQNLLNQLLIRGLTEAAGQRSSGPTASTETHRGLAQVPTPRDHRNRDGSHSVIAGRSPIPAPLPKMASMLTNVTNKTEVKVENERALQRAMESVSRELTAVIMRVRNDQLSLSNRLAGQTVVDLVC